MWPEIESQVADHGQQPAPQGQEVQGGAQVVADRALDLAGMSHQVVEAVILAQPFDGGLGADLVHAGYTVDLVTGERQIIDDAAGRHAELGEHAGRIEHFIAHGVDQRDAFIDQLCQILVAGGNQAIHASGAGLACQGADDIVGLHARYHDERPAGRTDAGMQWFDLRHQVVGHRGAVGLVVGIPVFAEGLALGVEHHRAVLWLTVPGRIVAQQAAQHAEHAVDGAGRLTCLVAQVGQGVKSAV